MLATAGEDVRLLDSFVFFFVIAAVSLPTVTASCSLAGAKVERILEPPASAPVPDAEILAGKVLDALLPPIAALCAAFALSMGLLDWLTRGALGYLCFPGWSSALVMFVLVPLVPPVATRVFRGGDPHRVEVRFTVDSAASTCERDSLR